MDNARHTPGPWKFAHGQNDLLTAPDGDDVAAVDVWFAHRSKTEQQANARLIAAAPELLEALRWAIKHVSVDPDHEGKKRIINLLNTL